MPFYRVQFDGKNINLNKALPFPTQPDQFPLFFIGGVLGNGREFEGLINQLCDSGDSRPIFIWCDPMLTADEKNASTKENHTLLDQAKNVVDCMLNDCLSTNPAPYLIVGYSYGCGLASLAAEELKRRDNNAALFLIDGPSPESSKKYFSRCSKDLTLDLVKIVNYAAELAQGKSLEDADKGTTEDKIAPMQSLSPLEIIQARADWILKNISDLDKTLFNKYIKIAKQNIHNLMNAPSHDPSSKPDSVVAVTTRETESKYGEFGGWAGHVVHIEDPELQSQPHTEILQTATGEKKLAHYVDLFINDSTCPDLMMLKYLQFMRKKFFEGAHVSHTEPVTIKRSPQRSPFDSPLSSSPSSEVVAYDDKSAQQRSLLSSGKTGESYSDDESTPVSRLSDSTDELLPGKPEEILRAIESLLSKRSMKHHYSFFKPPSSMTVQQKAVNYDGSQTLQERVVSPQDRIVSSDPTSTLKHH